MSSRYPKSSFRSRDDEEVTLPVASSVSQKVVGTGNSVRLASPGSSSKTARPATIVIEGHVDPSASISRGPTKTPSEKRYIRRDITPDEARKIVRRQRELTAARELADAQRRAAQAAAEAEAARIAADQTADEVGRLQAVFDEEAEELTFEEQMRLAQERSYLEHKLEEDRRLQAEIQERQNREYRLEMDRQNAEREAAEREDRARLLAEEEKARRNRKPVAPRLITIDARVPDSDIYTISLRYPDSPKPVAYSLHKDEPMKHLFDLVRYQRQNSAEVTLVQSHPRTFFHQKDYNSGMVTIDEALNGVKRILLSVQES